MLTRVLPTALVIFTGIQGICTLLAAGPFSCCHPQGDEIESVLLAQICCWKCPELAVYKWRASLHCCSAHEGTTTLCEAAPCSFYPGSGNFCIPTGLAQAVGRSHSELELREVIRDLGLRKKPQ